MRMGGDNLTVETPTFEEDPGELLNETGNTSHVGNTMDVDRDEKLLLETNTFDVDPGDSLNKMGNTLDVDTGKSLNGIGNTMDVDPGESLGETMEVDPADAEQRVAVIPLQVVLSVDSIPHSNPIRIEH
jgi:hypothetical protein